MDKKMKKSIRRFFPLTLVIYLMVSCCDVHEACIEKPKDDCACITLYDPVCGCNGITYGNACEAACAGITDYTPGACELTD
jgi:hypothetical protein